MPSINKRAGLFKFLHTNDKRISNTSSGKKRSLLIGPDALVSQDLVECYKIVDAACKALHAKTYATPEIMEIFFRNVFDNWSIGDAAKKPELLYRIPLLEPMHIRKRFAFPEDLSYRVSIESDPLRLSIAVEDPLRMVAGLANTLCKDGSPQSSGYQDELMAAVSVSCMERIQSHNARRAVQYARSYLNDNDCISGDKLDFTDLELFVRLLPGLSIPELSDVEAALLKWGP